jgi:hypothetical protein
MVEHLFADAVYTPKPLYHPNRVPGYIVVNDHAGTVKVKPFAQFVGTKQDVVIIKRI